MLFLELVRPVSDAPALVAKTSKGALRITYLAGVLGRPFMTVGTVGRVEHCPTSAVIFGLRDRLKMSWVVAENVQAPVVDVQAVWNRSVRKFVRNTMDGYTCSSPCRVAVAVFRFATAPVPAAFKFFCGVFFNEINHSHPGIASQFSHS